MIYRSIFCLSASFAFASVCFRTAVVLDLVLWRDGRTLVYECKGV